MVGRVEVRSCIQMSLMYRSNSYIVHHCWFRRATTMAFAFSLFQHNLTSPLASVHLRLAHASFHPRTYTDVHCYRTIYSKRQAFVIFIQWFHAIFSPKTSIQSLCDFVSSPRLLQSTCNDTTAGKFITFFFS